MNERSYVDIDHEFNKQSDAAYSVLTLLCDHFADPDRDRFKDEIIFGALMGASDNVQAMKRLFEELLNRHLEDRQAAA